jgi:hypothetical protein
MPIVFAMSVGRIPCSFNSRTRASPLVDAGCLRLGDALKLALAAKVGLELGEHAEHVEEALAGGSAGVDGLLGLLEAGALGTHARTMSRRSPMLRATRSMRVTMRHVAGP